MQAKTLYEQIRSAFGVLTLEPREYWRRANQHAWLYCCSDGSQLIIYHKGGCAWRNDKGYIMARRTTLCRPPTLGEQVQQDGWNMHGMGPNGVGR